MTAAHFFVDPGEAPIEEGARVLLSPKDSHHAGRVLRLRAGEEVSVADGGGRVGVGAFGGEEGGRAAVAVRTVSTRERPMPRIEVALAPPKGDRLSWAIQKLAEVGADAAVLVATERAVRSVDDRSVERLRTIAREAAMQSRRAFLMDVDAVPTLRAVIEGGGRAVVLLHTKASTALRAVLPTDASHVTLVVGPEGGFTDDELALAADAGAAVATMGEQVLRTETAAVVGAALVLSQYERLG